MYCIPGTAGQRMFVVRVDLLVQQTCVRVFFVHVCTPAYRSLASFGRLRSYLLCVKAAHKFCTSSSRAVDQICSSNFQPGISAHREHCTLPTGAWRLSSTCITVVQYSIALILVLAIPEVLALQERLTLVRAC